MRFKVNENLYPLFVTIGVLIVMLVGGSFAYGMGRGGFLSFRNIVSLFNNNPSVGVAAIGATLVILSGGIDLSVGAVVACAAVSAAWLIESAHVHPVLAAMIIVAGGCLYGLVSGSIIYFFNQPPFLITLAGMFFIRSVGYVVSMSSIQIHHKFVSWVASDASIQLATGVKLGVGAMAMLTTFIVAGIVLHLTAFGRDVYAVGGDEASARLMGVRVGRTKVLVYTLAGALSALAGVLATINTQSGNPAAYEGLELDVIAAVVIGGTVLTGGRGYLVGSLVGVLILGVIQSLLLFQGNLSSWWAQIFVAALMLAFIVTQKLLTYLGGNAQAGH